MIQWDIGPVDMNRTVSASLRKRTLGLVLQCRYAGFVAGGGARATSHDAGGTYSLGGAAPSPKKYCSIWRTMTSWSSRRAGFRRYSFRIILQKSIHWFHACWETF